MKLVEKKCPNCGAGLEFSETDKSCKCSYCHRAFEIERDQNNNGDDLAQQYILNELPATFLKIHYLIVIAIILGIFIFIFLGFKTMHGTNKSWRDNFFNTKTENKEKLFTCIEELGNEDFEALDNDANMIISKTGNGVNDSHHTYNLDGKPNRAKVYVFYKEKANYIISIYQTTYHDFFHQENSYNVFVPILYENINSNTFDRFINPQIKAPEYYFNEEKTSFTYGYASLDEVYSNVVKPLIDEGFKVTEK